MTTQSKPPVVGILLASNSHRTTNSGEKCLKKLMGKPVLSYVIERALPQVTSLILNANGDPTRFQDISIPVVPDAIEELSGPLAGILTGMEWARDNDPKAEWLATFATDSPFIPHDLVLHMLEEIERHQADMAYISCGGKPHPEYGLWPVELAEDLRYALTEENIKSVDKWTQLYNAITVEYPAKPIDRFTLSNNIEGIVDVERNYAAQ